MNWYESPTLKYLTSVEFGYNSIHDFDIYQDVNTGEYLTLYHDDPDVPGSLAEIAECMAVSDADPRYAPQQAQNRANLAAAGIIL